MVNPESKPGGCSGVGLDPVGTIILTVCIVRLKKCYYGLMDHFRRLVGKHNTYLIYKKYSNYKLFFSKEKYFRIENFPFKLRGVI